MKAVIAVFSVVALLGVVYGLAFLGVIPVQKMAGKSPALASALSTLHLAKAKKPAPRAVPEPASDPERVALSAQKKALAADRAQLDKDRADLEARRQQPPAPQTGGASPAPDDTAKLGAIYATMSPDDLSRIFGKLPDPDVIRSLTQLDEKKAGQVLAALPADRAARLAKRMSAVSLASAPGGGPAALPRTSL